MTGMGRNASSVSVGEITANVGADQHHVGRGEDQFVGALVEEALELVDVVVEHRHQAAGRAVLEVRQLELLHVAVRVHAHVVLDGLREVAPQHVRGVVRQRLENPDRDGDDGEDRDLVGAVVDAGEPADERLLVVDDHVDGDADEQLRQRRRRSC